ncbi:SWIM zinc finger family protein [Streptosporangium canum]|uniref:SWIM zinc finger family protein n=1 Tax=Streptosporangium canum TaxID=324952 RepID=UPI0033BF8C69
MNSPTSTVPPAGQLPPAAPHVVAAAVEGLTSRLRKKLDAAIEQYAATPAVADGENIRISCGEDAVVTLSPGASGAIADDGQAWCSCLLAPRCLHRAAVLSACPVADADADAGTDAGAGAGADTHMGTDAGAGAGVDADTHAGASVGAGAGADIAAGAANGPLDGSLPGTGSSTARDDPSHDGTAAGTTTGPTAAQVAAASGLWAAAAAILSAGVPAAGAVPQAELLRAAHTARLAGLPRAEAAALRVVRGLRAARDRHDGHRLADLVAALRELLLTAGRLAAADPDPALVGSVRRSYQPGGSLRVYGVFREPVISGTGYGGVVTHLVTDDGRWFSVADVKPGGSARARGAATAPVAIGPAMLNHAQLARAGLLIAGATISPDGRLGAGGGVRATPIDGMSWTAGPLAALFARPLAEAVGARLSGQAWSESEAAERANEPVGCDLMIVGAAGDHVLARELLPAGAPPERSGPENDDPARRPSPAGAPSEGSDPADDDPARRPPPAVRPDGPLIRLIPAGSHPDLAHVANLRQLASRPGTLVRVVGRLDPGRAATLRPLAIGPVPGAEATLRLPAGWQGRADLGYDRLQGSHLPPHDACPPWQAASEADVDPVAGAPLWRVRRLVELAVAGGRRAVAEHARSGDSHAQGAPLRRAGFEAAAELAAALTAEADRRSRDVFGRSTDSGPDGYAWAWLAAAIHLAAADQALVQASWHAGRC